jgi:prepilin-type N-terminal cleavage/methylation domain-containing protein
VNWKIDTLAVILMFKINRKLSQKGFTLIEIIVAVGILGIVSLGIVQSYRAGFWGMSDAKMRTIATNIAQEKLEEVKGKSLDAGTYPDPDNPIIVSGKEFNATVIVDEVTTTLKKITATVSWQKRNGDSTQISIESLQNMAPASPSDDVATAILVSANPASINVGDTSQIKVTILDQDNYPISFNGQVDLSLIPSSPVLGTLTDNSLTFIGESYLYTTFTSTDAGEVNVKGESEGLISDSDTITITGGAPVKINLVADPTSVLINGETSTLTVRIEDENDYLADSWTGTVQLSITSGQDTGDLGDPPAGDTITIDFVDENVKTTLFTSSTEAGEAVIEATDQAGVLTADTETIYVSSGPPTKIDIEADPKNIFIEGYADGPTSSTVTVTIKNATDVPTSGWIGTVTLSILSGEDSGTLETTTLNFNGESELSTIFNSSGEAGIVEIKAEDTTGGPGYTPLTSDTETITVAAGPPDHLELIAVPDIILNNGLDSSTLMINVVDFAGNRTAFTEDDKIISFTLSPDEGTVNNAPLTLPAGESQLITTYVCNNSEFEGDVIITAHCEGITDASDTVQVGSRIIRPADDPNIRYGTWYWREDERKVLFDIIVMGGTIEITQIDLAWKESPTSEYLRAITIYEQGEPSNRKIRKTWSWWNDPLIPIYPNFYEITSFDQNEDLVEGDYTVELDYDRDIHDRTIIIRFHGRYEGTDYIYQLEFLSPDQIV